MATSPKFELIKFPRTDGAPNSIYPVIIYRNVLPTPDDQDSVVAMLDGNGYSPYGFFGGIGLQHFHSNTHEIYSFTAGSAAFILGCAGNDDIKIGRKVELFKGDVLVLPAGTAHGMQSYSEDVRYCGAYPRGSAHWDVHRGLSTSEISRDAIIRTVESIPIFGPHGPLPRHWAIAAIAKP